MLVQGMGSANPCVRRASGAMLGDSRAPGSLQALRTGRHEGQGRPILPPMPWPMFRNATDEDLGAIFAYLQSIPPIRNKVPQPIDPPEAP